MIGLTEGQDANQQTATMWLMNGGDEKCSGNQVVLKEGGEIFQQLHV
jgi:hypothetical protein